MLGAFKLISFGQLFLYLFDLQINLFELSKVGCNLLQHWVVFYVFYEWHIVINILEILFSFCRQI